MRELLKFLPALSENREILDITHPTPYTRLRTLFIEREKSYEHFGLPNQAVSNLYSIGYGEKPYIRIETVR